MPEPITYDLLPTAVGRLLLATADTSAVVACLFAPDAAVVAAAGHRLARNGKPPVRSPAAVAAARDALEAYLAGERRDVAAAVDGRMLTAFQARVLTAVADLAGYGQRTSYAAVARHLGSPGAARAVGSALGSNPLCVVLPCHRVLPAAGGLGGYAGGPAAKATLLGLEEICSADTVRVTRQEARAAISPGRDRPCGLARGGAEAAPRPGTSDAVPTEPRGPAPSAERFYPRGRDGERDRHRRDG